jgi:hypothetical protein
MILQDDKVANLQALKPHPHLFKERFSVPVLFGSAKVRAVLFPTKNF